MFCPNCGNELPDGAKFCPQCGTVISSKDTQKSPPQPAPVPHAKKNPQRSKFIIGISAAVFCIALGVGLHFYHEYQMKVKAAEIYKERFGIEVDPNDITLYDNLQEALADDSWQGGSSPALATPPSPEESMETTTEYDRDGDIASITTEPIQPIPSTQPNIGVSQDNTEQVNSEGNYDDIAGTYVDEYGSGFYMFIGYEDSSKQTAYLEVELVAEMVTVELTDRSGNSISGNNLYQYSQATVPTQIVDLEYDPYDGSITATIYAVTQEDTIRFVPCFDAPYSNPYYVG